MNSEPMNTLDAHRVAEIRRLEKELRTERTLRMGAQSMFLHEQKMRQEAEARTRQLLDVRVESIPFLGDVIRAEILLDAKAIPDIDRAMGIAVPEMRRKLAAAKDAKRS